MTNATPDQGKARANLSEPNMGAVKKEENRLLLEFYQFTRLRKRYPLRIIRRRVNRETIGIRKGALYGGKLKCDL
jgi:hypothetical protein